MTQPVITSAREAVVSGGFQLLVLAAAHQIDGFRQMFGDVELVKDDLTVCFGKILAGGVDVRVPHIHGHSANRRSLLLRQALPEPIQTFLGSVLRHKQHPAPIQIVDQGEVVVPFGKRLLIDSQTLDGLGLAANQAASHGPLLNRMHLVPTQPELISDGFLTGCLEPIDGQSFNQSREPAGWLGPRKLYGSCAMRGAVAARRFGMQDRLILTGVQMPPPAFGLMIVEWAWLAALRTRPLYSGLMNQMNVNFSIPNFSSTRSTLHGDRIPRIWAYSSLSCTCPLCPYPLKSRMGPEGKVESAIVWIGFSENQYNERRFHHEPSMQYFQSDFAVDPASGVSRSGEGAQSRAALSRLFQLVTAHLDVVLPTGTRPELAGNHRRAGIVRREVEASGGGKSTQTHHVELCQPAPALAGVRNRVPSASEALSRRSGGSQAEVPL